MHDPKNLAEILEFRSLAKNDDILFDASVTLKKLVAENESMALQNKGLNDTVFCILEGYNIPDTVRKVLEMAYYNKVFLEID